MAAALAMETGQPGFDEMMVTPYIAYKPEQEVA
jgi:hypothetical protein